MAYEGELPDVDLLKMTPGELDLPGPTLSLDLPGPGLDLPVPPAASTGQTAAKKAAPGKKPVAAKPQAQKAAPKKAASKTAPRGDTMQLVLGLASIVLLVIVAGVLLLFEVPVNTIPDLTLLTYVQALWLLLGCLFIVAMLLDIKTALMLTGADLVLMATVFPTLWLLLNMPMNPLYFFVIGLIMLLAFVYLPLNLLRPKAAGAAAPAKA